MFDTLREELGPHFSALAERFDDDVLGRLDDVLRRPNDANWSNAAHILVGFGKGRTLWQMVRQVNPAFTTAGPRTERDPETGRSRRVMDWPEVPDRKTLAEALRRCCL